MERAAVLFDGASHRFNVGTGHVGSFGLRDFPAAERGNFTYFCLCSGLPTRLDTSRFFSRTAAGGVLVTKVKERSA